MRPPSVDALARELTQHSDLPHAMLVGAARAGIAAAVGAGEPANALTHAVAAARRAERRMLVPVINATGVLLHTNLGRAPVPTVAPAASVRYANLELDLETGTRGSRRDLTTDLFTRLCGAESALVVNNCAAAVMLALAAHATGAGVVVSRGELVEIGGGFRIPDVLGQSGARLIEVGTTNRTRLADYQRAVNDPANDARVVLKVHQSNYRITGFTEEVPTTELATLGRLVVHDLGSGLLDSRLPWLADPSGAIPHLPWLAGEPGVRQSLEAGADLVIVSGDKLLGGPQAGIIVGTRAAVDACASHPLARALRAGGLVLDALQRALLCYLRGDAMSLPFWRAATRTVSELNARAQHIVDAVADPAVHVVGTDAVPGGGTLPDARIPSAAVGIANDQSRRLRDADVPIIARVENGATLLDLRTVDPADDHLIAAALTGLLSSGPTASTAPNNNHDRP